MARILSRSHTGVEDSCDSVDKVVDSRQDVPYPVRDTIPARRFIRRSTFDCIAHFLLVDRRERDLVSRACSLDIREVGLRRLWDEHLAQQVDLFWLVSASPPSDDCSAGMLLLTDCSFVLAHFDTFQRPRGPRSIVSRTHWRKPRRKAFPITFLSRSSLMCIPFSLRRYAGVRIFDGAFERF